MRRTIPILLTLLAALTAAHAEGIAWHEGEVSGAFDRAHAEGKPLFLYWGAVWCPPCNQIKQTIFTQRSFIDTTKLFVPVYLDGDTESAQIWGEKLDVLGYPTMLVLSPEGREVMRLPTGLQIEEFNRVLDEALARMTPIEEVLEAALAEPDPSLVSDRSYRLLAFYSWGQNRQLEFSPEEWEARFRELAERVPERLSVERSRLYLRWLEQASGVEPAKLSKPLRREADQRLLEILESPELTRANLQFLSYYAGSIVPLVHPRNNSGRRRLIDAWEKAMVRAENDDSLSIDERLRTLMPSIDFYELQRRKKTPADTELQARVLHRVKWTDENATDHYTRQASMSAAGHLLEDAGLEEEARKLYLAEVEKSETPYYFMSSLASMAHEAGNDEEATTWLARAYDSAEGGSTRFQWGTSYLLGLMEMSPDDAECIRDESLRVFGQHLEQNDAFAGRHQSRIEWLAEKYAEWNAEEAHAAEIEALRTALLPSCDSLDDDAEEGEKSLQDRCEEFFTSLGTAPQPAPAS